MNRRKLLSTVAPAALALSGVAAAAPAAINPDVGMLALCAEYEALQAVMVEANRDATKAAAEAGAATARLQVEAMHLELRKIDRFLEQARISLGEKESATVQALVDGFTEKAHEVMVIRARAWSQTRYLQTAGALVFTGFLLLGGGYWAGASRPGNGAPHDFIQQCASSLRRDPATGRTFCAVEVSGR